MHPALRRAAGSEGDEVFYGIKYQIKFKAMDSGGHREARVVHIVPSLLGSKERRPRRGDPLGTSRRAECRERFLSRARRCLRRFDRFCSQARKTQFLTHSLANFHTG